MDESYGNKGRISPGKPKKSILESDKPLYIRETSETSEGDRIQPAGAFPGIFFNHPFQIVPVTGVRNHMQLEEAVGACELDLAPELFEGWIKKIG